MIDISKCEGFETHRMGWKYAINSLMHIHTSSGIFLDDFIERSHSWNHHHYYTKSKREIPYKKKWVGFFHIPPNCPTWYDFCHTPQAIIQRETFQASLKNCLGLFTLTDYLRDFIKDRVDVPVSTVRYPTDLSPEKWTEQKFLSNKEKKIIQLGAFLRESYAIIHLKTEYHKVWFPGNFEFAKHYQRIEETTSTDWGYLDQKMDAQVWTPRERVENETYDEYVAKNIAFVKLYDTSANTAIVESIARDAPIVVNRLPGAEEYLGKDYPLFYNDLDEASRLIRDTDKILEGHYYIKNMDKSSLEGGEFCNSVRKKVREWLN
jgi:hypothetical protein